MIAEVLEALPPEIQQQVSEPLVEARLLKFNGDVKRTVANIKKQYGKKAPEGVSVRAVPTRGKTPAPRTPAPRSPLPVASPIPSAKMREVIQHSQAVHKQTIDAITAERTHHPASVTVMFCGHVDAGKSTVVGHLLHEIGVVTHGEVTRNRTMCVEAKKKSFEYAWVMDTDEDERNRGITISVGSVEFEERGKRVRILDTPGHADFFAKTLDAMFEADVAVIVVDAEHPHIDQEQEGTFHDIVTTLLCSPVRSIVVAINKMDAMKWSRDRCLPLVKQIETFIRKHNKSIPVQYVPISGLTGENLVSATQSSRWAKKTLIDVLIQEQPRPRLLELPLRALVADATKQNDAVVLAATLEAGVVVRGDNVVVAPTHEIATVRKIMRGQRPVEHAGAGDSVELTLAGLDSNVRRKYVVAAPSEAPSFSRKFNATVVLETGELMIRRGTLMTFFCATGYSPAVFARIYFSGVRDVRVRPKKLRGSVEAQVEVILRRSLCVDSVTNVESLSWFVLRYNGKTIGRGTITEIRD